MEHEKKEANYFASMTDMMVGILFIFVIMIAYFAFKASDSSVPRVSIYSPRVIWQEGVDESIEIQLRLSLASSKDTLIELSYPDSSASDGTDVAQIHSVTMRAGETSTSIHIPIIDDDVFEGDETLIVRVGSISTGSAVIDETRRESILVIKDDQTMNALEAYIKSGTESKKMLALSIASTLRSIDVDANSTSEGVITISGRGLFASGESSLDSIALASERVDKIGKVLSERMRCFSMQVVNDEVAPFADVNYGECNRDLVMVESVFIEGHTDNETVNRVLKDGSRSNLELSSKRAISSYQRLKEFNPSLLSFMNPSGKQALSVSAYGKQRPIADNSTSEGKEKNRRIDIRFVMHVPASVNELQELKAKFGDAK